MELIDIKNLIADFENGSIRELKIDDGDFHLELSKNEYLPTPASVITTSNPVIGTQNEATMPVVPAVSVVDETNVEFIKAPLVGSIYLQASEGVSPFVEKGQHIEKGQTVAIIEAMKMMTEIKAAVSGKIDEILVKNEEIVEFDKPLFKVVCD